MKTTNKNKYKVIAQAMLIVCLAFSFTKAAAQINDSGTDHHSWVVNADRSYNSAATSLYDANNSYRLANDIGVFSIRRVEGNTFLERISILSNGDVGIGLNSPSEKLHVAGNIFTDGDAKISGETYIGNNGWSINADNFLAFKHPNSPSYGAFLVATDGSMFTDGGVISKGSFSSEDKVILKNTTVSTTNSWFLKQDDSGGLNIGKGEFLPTGGELNTEDTINAITASISEDGATMVGIGTMSVVDGATLTVDGRVYISENGGAEEGFDDITDDNYKDYLLWVEEGIVSSDFALADLSDWPDYVFEEDYNLPSLETVENSIKTNGHLHTMPSAKTIEKNGFTVKDMTKRMVKTIEELTLHTISQEKQIDAQKNKLELQNKLLDALMQRIEKLEQQRKD